MNNLLVYNRKILYGSLDTIKKLGNFGITDDYHLLEDDILILTYD